MTQIQNTSVALALKDLDRQHRMVRSFLCRQKEKGGNREEMALAVAKDNSRRRCMPEEK